MKLAGVWWALVQTRLASAWYIVGISAVVVCKCMGVSVHLWDIKSHVVLSSWVHPERICLLVRAAGLIKRRVPCMASERATHP
eukprot:1094259-Prorocentrum_minimum.AAC.5